MSERWDAFKAAVREMFAARYPEDPDPDSTAADTAARTAWIRGQPSPTDRR